MSRRSRAETGNAVKTELYKDQNYVITRTKKNAWAVQTTHSTFHNKRQIERN